VIYFVKKTNK